VGERTTSVGHEEKRGKRKEERGKGKRNGDPRNFAWFLVSKKDKFSFFLIYFFLQKVFLVVHNIIKIENASKKKKKNPQVKCVFFTVFLHYCTHKNNKAQYFP
jgi:hypothetical protein